MANVPVAWTQYPDSYTSMPGGPPGKGETVSTFQILFGAPPPPLSSNPWLQEFNKRLNVNWQAVLADSPDYVAKLNTLAASGSFPDITYINFNQNGLYNGAGFQKYISEGAFHDLTPTSPGTPSSSSRTSPCCPRRPGRGRRSRAGFTAFRTRSRSSTAS